MTSKITRNELQEKLNRGDAVILVDALAPSTYEQAHLPGALNIPHDQVHELAAKLLPDKSAEIVTYCANGPCQGSAIAANKLEELGYKNVKDYELGKQDWVEAGLPTESGARASH